MKKKKRKKSTPSNNYDFSDFIVRREYSLGKTKEENTSIRRSKKRRKRIKKIFQNEDWR